MDVKELIGSVELRLRFGCCEDRDGLELEEVVCWCDWVFPVPVVECKPTRRTSRAVNVGREDKSAC